MTFAVIKKLPQGALKLKILFIIKPFISPLHKHVTEH